MRSRNSLSPPSETSRGSTLTQPLVVIAVIASLAGLLPHDSGGLSPSSSHLKCHGAHAPHRGALRCEPQHALGELRARVLLARQRELFFTALNFNCRSRASVASPLAVCSAAVDRLARAAAGLANVRI